MPEIRIKFFFSTYIIKFKSLHLFIIMSESRSDLSFDMGWGFIRGKVSRKKWFKTLKKEFYENY